MSDLTLTRAEILEHAIRIGDEYAEQGLDLTLRQLYYRFVALGLLPSGRSSARTSPGTGTAPSIGRTRGGCCTSKPSCGRRSPSPGSSTARRRRPSTRSPTRTTMTESDDAVLFRLEAGLVPGERCPLCRERVSGCRACSDSRRGPDGGPCTHCDVGVNHGSDFVRRRGRSFLNKFNALHAELEAERSMSRHALDVAGVQVQQLKARIAVLEGSWWERLRQSVAGVRARVTWWWADVTGPRCDGCGWRIDPDCCCCGSRPGDSEHGGGSWESYTHSFVPMGCVCGYGDPKPPRSRLGRLLARWRRVRFDG